MAFSYDNYTGNGATTQFSITFTYQNTSEISVTVDGVAETGLTFPSSSTVQLTSAPASGTLVQVRRTTDLTARAVDFASGSVLTEEDLDNSSIQTFHASQEAIDRANDAIALDDDDKWDAQNNVIKNVGTPTNANDATTKSYVDTSANNAASSAAAALVSQNASAASATASANSASASAGSATTSANESTDSANSATASAASAATATTQAALATSNGAAQVALATSQADNAAASATTAATQATLATTNGAAQVALATTQANNAASSASTAATQATASASSASTSTTQATNSANSATASANSASSASNAQTAAESARDATLAAYDNFDDRYLGTKSSAPTVDNDGDALVAGALYFDSVAGAMYVYTGSAWVAAYVSGTGFLALTGGTMSGDLNFGDNDKATFGDAVNGDLRIYHDASNSFIQDAGTGSLFVQATNLILRSNDTGENYMRGIENGTVELYHNGIKKIETTGSGIDVTGSVVADGLTVNSGGDQEVYFGDATDGIALATTGAISSIEFGNSQGAGGVGRFAFDRSTGNLVYSEGVNGSESDYFSIDTAGKVGIGTTSPTHELTVSAANDRGIRIDAEGNNVALMLTDETTSNGFRLNYNAPSDVLSFDTTNGTGAKVSERMRIDSSGNLLVGATAEADWETVAGFRTRQSGSTTITRSAAPVLYVNRLTSDGDLVEFRKDGSAVGSIGSSLGEAFIGGKTKGIRFSAVGFTGTNNTGALSDGAIDIGTSSHRIKDLYLSSGVYLGGTANANKLDDYEEGIWTPSFNLVTVTHTLQYGKYVKIGKMVHLKGYISVSSIDNTDNSGIQMTVPISANSANSNGSRGCTFAHDAASSTLLDGSHASVQGAYVSGTTFAITNTGGGNFTYNQLTQSSGVFIFALTYEAA